MSKRTVFTTITPLPPGIGRETVMETLHSHVEMIDLNPLVIERHVRLPPADATPEEAGCIWYSLTDRVSYMPGVSGKVTYNACFHDLADGVQTHVFAPLGLDIKEKWSIGGSLPGEDSAPVELGLDIPREGLYLREDCDMRCNVLMTKFVKGTLKRAHAVLVDLLVFKAGLTEIAGATPTRLSAGQRTASSSAASSSDYSEPFSSPGFQPFSARSSFQSVLSSTPSQPPQPAKTSKPSKPVRHSNPPGPHHFAVELEADLPSITTTAAAAKPPASVPKPLAPAANPPKAAPPALPPRHSAPVPPRTTSPTTTTYPPAPTAAPPVPPKITAPAPHSPTTSAPASPPAAAASTTATEPSLPKYEPAKYAAYTPPLGSTQQQTKREYKAYTPPPPHARTLQRHSYAAYRPPPPPGGLPHGLGIGDVAKARARAVSDTGPRVGVGMVPEGVVELEG